MAAAMIGHQRHARWWRDVGAADHFIITIRVILHQVR